MLITFDRKTNRNISYWRERERESTFFYR